jgi:DNA-binding SARP family transcriptional activator/tetratricopeptide (TPR) repeat protein/DNA-binding XRE family transcriptional regulator
MFRTTVAFLVHKLVFMAGGQGESAVRLGILIASVRQAAGLTQQQLAEKAGVSLGTVRDLEQSRTLRPRRDTAETLALALGLDVERVHDAAGWLTGPGREGASAGGAPGGGPSSGARVGVLGPLAVWRDGQLAEIGAGQQRAVLGLLAIHPGHALHRETIIDAVWAHRPPASAVAMTQSYVSQLRRLLGERLLVSDGTSYRLVVSSAQLDALEFADLADQARDTAAAGDPAAACELFQQAAALWRGEPLADVGMLRGHPALTELAQEQATLILDYAAAAAEAGLPDRVLPQLRALATRSPLDERAHARLMLSLAGSGQQAAALAVFDDLRQRLDEELGITPGPDLTDAHLQVLRGQPKPVRAAQQAQPQPPVLPAPPQAGELTRMPPPRAVPRQLPAVVAGFTGRARELAELAQLQVPRAGPGTVVISAIGGMAGVGKTALAVYWAHRAAGEFPDGQLYVNMRGFGPADPVPPDEAVRGFLDALGVPVDQIPADPAARTGLYRSLLVNRRMLVVLDNVRDEQQARQLLPGASDCLVIVTSRHELAGLAAVEGASLLSLDLLTSADARALLTARLGADRAAAEPDAVTEITSLCARLPLALAVAAARAASRPRFSLAALARELRDARHRLDVLDTGDPTASVRAVFSWSYQQLSQPEAAMFRLLSLDPGPDIATAAAASLAGVSPVQADRTLTALTRTNLLSEHLPGRFVLHDLLRAYAADLGNAIDDDRARHDALHRLLGHYTHTARAAAYLLSPIRETVPIESPQPGVTPEPLADDQQALRWFESEHRVLISAVAAADQDGFDVCAWQLPWAMANFLEWRGYWAEWEATLRTAVLAATRLGDTAAKAATRRMLAHTYARRGEYDQARIHLTDCLGLYRRLGDPLGEARVHQTLGWVAEYQDRKDDALHHNEQALALSQSVGYREGQAAALNNVGWCHALLGHYEQARTYCYQALELRQEFTDRPGDAGTWDSLGYVEHMLGNLAEAAACYRRALDIFTELGDRWHQAEIVTHLGDALAAAGETAQAREAWEQALEIYEDLHHPEAGPVRDRLGR